MKKQTIGIIVTVLILGVIAVVWISIAKHNPKDRTDNIAYPLPDRNEVLTDVKIGEVAAGTTETTITPTQVTEDSRCPANANCIWAGRVVVKANVSFDGGLATEQSFESDKTLELPEGKITLTEVKPHKTLNGVIKPEDYLFTFSVAR